MKRAPKYVCSRCTTPYARWPGATCRSCGACSTSIIGLDEARTRGLPLPFSLLDDGRASRTRLRTGLDGLDRLASHEGGLVPGHSILMAAVPGGGKTTIWLQTAGEIARRRSAMYITAEQDTASLRTLAERVGAHERSKLLPLASRSLDEIEARVRAMRPAFACVDSASELAKAMRMPVDVVVGRLHALAHEAGSALAITSHTNGQHLVRGGPEVAHQTDAVFLLLGDPRTSRVREIVSDKNRLGDTTISVQIEVCEGGVRDYSPPEATAARVPRILGPGAALGLVTVDGTVRVVTVEAATSPTPASRARTIQAIGCSQPRVMTLVGVVERMGVELAGDVVVRIAEGVQVTDVAIDAAIVAAIISAAQRKAVAPGRVYSGEVGLDGRLRASAHEDEAARLGLRLAGKPGDRLAAAPP